MTNVFLNDIIGVEDLGTSGIIKQKKMAIAINNNEPELNSDYLKQMHLKEVLKWHYQEIS